jgi:hypothetical protein
MVKVDFAFWTGTDLIAVEIDEASHIGNPDQIRPARVCIARCGGPSSTSPSGSGDAWEEPVRQVVARLVTVRALPDSAAHRRP